MTGSRVPFCSLGWLVSQLQFRTWHLGLVVLYVAVAITNIQDQRINEPALMAVATTGFVGFAALSWLGWRYAQRFEARLGSLLLLALYLVGLASLFLVATGIYLAIEHAYLIGVGP